LLLPLGIENGGVLVLAAGENFFIQVNRDIRVLRKEIPREQNVEFLRKCFYSGR